jgi:M6 family metalloprotease-like protein
MKRKYTLSRKLHLSSKRISLFIQLFLVFFFTGSLFVVTYYLRNPSWPWSINAATTPIEGTARIQIGDDFINNKYTNLYYLETTVNGQKQKIPFNYTGKKIIKNGDVIKLNGYSLLNNTISKQTTDSDGDGLTIISSAGVQASPAVIGSPRVAVILVNWSNLGTFTPTKTEAYSLFHDQVAPFYKIVSYDKLNLNLDQTDVYGWYSISTPYTCDNFENLENYIFNSSIDKAVNFNNYNQLILVAPTHTDCSSGLAWIGGTTFNTNEGMKTMPLAKMSANNRFEKYVMIHELGHAYGAGHSNGLECGDYSFSDNCSVYDYGDAYDPMGQNWFRSTTFHFGPYNKYVFGWLSDNSFRTVIQSGDYFVFPIETVSDFTRGLKIYRYNSNEFFTVENRSNIGLDSIIPPEDISGAIIKYSQSYHDLYKIDGTPVKYGDWTDFADGDWEAGTIFNDCHGVKISSKGKSTVNNVNNVMTVHVDLNPNTPPPTFSDVNCTSPYYESIETLYRNNFTAGCTTNPLKFCPDQLMNRAQAAVFMSKGNFGGSYSPPPASHIFVDDWTNYIWAEPWAEVMYNNNLSAGCSTNPLKFCPGQILSKVEVAVFGLKLKYGPLFTAPVATGTVFYDMKDLSYWGTGWAERAFAEGLLPACAYSNGKPKFCPSSAVSRALAADVIVKAKNLH